MKKNIIINIVGILLFILASYLITDTNDELTMFLICMPLYIIGAILVYKSISYFMKEE